MGRSPDKYRVQLDFTPEGFRELENLKTAVQASNRADTVRYAMRVLRWLLDELRSGARIAVYRDNAFSEVKFPFLPHQTTEPMVGRDLAREFMGHSHEGNEAAVKRAREEALKTLKEKKREYESAREAGRQAYRDAVRRDDEETS